MKKLGLGILIGITVLALSGIATATPNQTQGEIDKIVFVHYPQRNVPYWSPAKAPAPIDQDTTYKYTGIHWSTTPVSYYDADGNLKQTTWPVEYYVNASEDYLGAVEAAFQTWEDELNSTMDFKFQGATILSGSALDGNDVVSWENISTDYPGAIAVTIVRYLRGSKVIVDVDTIMNSGSGFNWSVNDCTDSNCEAPAEVNSYDVQNIMTHEAGHWLMLLDLYQWRTQKLTMYGYGDFGELQKRTLGFGDKLGIDRIY